MSLDRQKNFPTVKLEPGGAPQRDALSGLTLITMFIVKRGIISERPALNSRDTRTYTRCYDSREYGERNKIYGN